MKNLDLDVDTPEKVPVVLRAAAQQYRDSAGELSSAWQDRQAGAIWNRLATVLERAANSAEHQLTQLGFRSR